MKLTFKQTDFSGGQADDTVERREDDPFTRKSLRRGVNMRVTGTGALTRRPGRRAIYRGRPEAHDRLRFASNEEWRVYFEPRSVRLVPVVTASGGVERHLVNMPWTDETVGELEWVAAEAKLIVAHQSFRPIVITLNLSTGAWVSSDFAFGLSPSGESQEPFYRFPETRGITVQPSALSGSITVTASEAMFSSDMVGSRLRYGERQVLISGVSSASQASGTVLDELPPSKALTVSSASGIQVGDVVAGSESGAEGTVISIVGATVTVLMSKNWSGFTTSDKLVAPAAQTTISAVASATPVASTFWDESFCSDGRGWPGSITYDRQRLVFTRFAQAERAILESAVGDIQDFLIGAEATNAFMEFVPDNCEVLYVAGGADQFVCCDSVLYFIPISTGSPLRPGSIEFREISRDGVAPIRPKSSTDGLIFINANRTRVMAMIGTGQASRPYIIEDLSEKHSQIISGAVSIAVSSSDVSAPERYIYVVNGDGSMAVAQYKQRREFVGWLPWTGAGAVKWVCASADEVSVIVEYASSIADNRLVEALDDTLLVDGVCNPATESSLLINEGEMWIMQGDWPRGVSTVISGALPLADIPLSPTGTVLAGYHFDVDIEPFVPHAPEGQTGRQRLRRRRAGQVGAKVIRSGSFEMAGKLYPFYRAGEDQGVAPTLRQDVYRTRPLGRSFDPSIAIRQEVPARLTIMELTVEVTN